MLHLEKMKKESILLPFLILLFTVWTDGSRSILRRKQLSGDRCHRLQETRRCPGATRTWHYDVRVSECRRSNEEECGAIGNRFRSKEDCEQTCVDRCHRMQESRLCHDTARSWHYDVRVSECRSSNDSDCGAVGNQFRAKEDCENMCGGDLNISARQSHIIGSGYWQPNHDSNCNGHGCHGGDHRRCPPQQNCPHNPCPQTPCPQRPCPQDPCHQHPCPQHPCPQHPCPQHPCPQHPCPQHPCPQQPCPQHPCPQYPCPQHSCPQHPCPQRSCPQHPCPQHPCPQHPCPHQPCPQHPCPQHPCPHRSCPQHPCPQHPCPQHPCPQHPCPTSNSPCPEPCPHPTVIPHIYDPFPCPNNNSFIAYPYQNRPAPQLRSLSACSNVHCPTVCSSNRLSPFLKNICCGCRTGTIIRPPCSSHNHCGHYRCNTTDHKCGSTTAPATTVAPTGPVPPPELVICPINDPSKECGSMRCIYGFKRTAAGCPYCECEEDPVLGRQGSLPYALREFGRFCNSIRATCRLDCPQGYVKDRFGCDVCRCAQVDIPPSSDCSLKPSCTMFCEHGFQKGPDGCEICLCNHNSPEKSLSW